MGRFLAGVTHGLILHTIIIHAGELGIRSIRQLVIRPIGVTILVGIAFQKCLFDLLPANDSYFLLPGVVSLVLAVAGLILSFTFTHESVPWLIRSGNSDNLALETWLALQDEPAANPESRIVREFYDLKADIEAQSQTNRNVLADGNIKSLFKCTLVRIISALVMSPALFALITLAEHRDTFSVLNGVLLRVLMALVFLYFLVDHLSKDADSILSVVWFGIKLVFLNVSVIFEWSNWFTTLTWYCTLASLVIAPPVFEFLGHIYLSELFPYSKKDWSVAIVLIIEYIVHIALIAASIFVPLASSHNIMIFFGAAMIILGLAAGRLVTEKELLTTHEERHARQLSTSNVASSSS